MRQDQYEKLQNLTERLADVFLHEANPDHWPGSGLIPANMDKETRGNRYWCKKDAAATLTVLMRTTTLIGVIQRRTADGEPPLEAGDESRMDDNEGSIDAEIAAAEKEAERLMKKLTSAQA